MTKAQTRNALRICELVDHFGNLTYNLHGQTPISTLNLSIPCAQLVCAGIVTRVADTNDGINDNAVADVENLCRLAVERQTTCYGEGWWTDAAKRLLP